MRKLTKRIEATALKIIELAFDIVGIHPLVGIYALVGIVAILIALAFKAMHLGAGL